MSITSSSSSFTRLAGACALLACPVALTSFFLLPVAFNGDIDAVFDPARGIAAEGVRAGLFRLAWALDIVGYYFLLLPAVLVLAARRAETAPLWSRLGEKAAWGYMLVGGSGAAILVGSSRLFERHAEGDAALRPITAELYTTIFHLVDKGLWNTLCMSLLAIWLLSVGRFLARERRALGLGMIALGACCVLDVGGGLLGVEAVALLGLMGYLLGFPLWSAALGLHLWRSAGRA